MRTSVTQFELLVTFMEQHGDLSKPSSSTKGRLISLQKWEELTSSLNNKADRSGDTKTLEKWKKVWSDYKNNTKRKAARLHRAAIAPGGDPAVFSKLTDLEQRVLNLMGIQVAKGLGIQGAGIAQETQQQDTKTLDFIVQPTEYVILSPTHFSTEEEVASHQPWHDSGPSSPRVPSPSIVESHDATPSPTMMNKYSPSLAVEVLVGNSGTTSGTPKKQLSHMDASSIPAEPAQSGQTKLRRENRTRSTFQGLPRKRLRSSQTAQAAQRLLKAELSWRKFKIEQHRDYMEMRKEQNRIRELELHTYRDTQREWQKIGSRVLDILNMVVSKFCDD